MSGRAKDRRGYRDTDAAGALGVDERTVRRWRNKGWVVNGPDGHLDVRATLARVAADRDPTLGGKPDRLAGGAAPASGDGARLLKARAMRETLQAKLLQMAVEREEGRIVDYEAAKRIWVEVITEARTRIEAIPDRVAPRLVNIPDARTIRDILRQEHTMALQGVREIPEVPGANDGPGQR